MKNHEKSFHLLEMCDFFLTFSDDFLKISIHPHHFGAFGQYPSSPKLKGAKNFLKKENIEKVPHVFSNFPAAFGGFFNRHWSQKSTTTQLVCSNQQLWWNHLTWNHQGTLEERDCHGHILNVDDHRSVPVYFFGWFCRFFCGLEKEEPRKKTKKTPTFHYNWVVCNPLYTLNNQGVFHCSDVAIMQSISKKLIHGTLPSTIMKVKSKNLRYETHLPGTYYRLCMFVQR